MESTPTTTTVRSQGVRPQQPPTPRRFALLDVVEVNAPGYRRCRGLVVGYVAYWARGSGKGYGLLLRNAQGEIEGCVDFLEEELTLRPQSELPFSQVQSLLMSRRIEVSRYAYNVYDDPNRLRIYQLTTATIE